MRGLLAKVVNLLKRLFFLKAIDESPENILLEVHKKKGLLWEKIEEFRKQIVSLDGLFLLVSVEQCLVVTHRIGQAA